jgi:hypothetical protein
MTTIVLAATVSVIHPFNPSFEFTLVSSLFVWSFSKISMDARLTKTTFAKVVAQQDLSVLVNHWAQYWTTMTRDTKAKVLPPILFRKHQASDFFRWTMSLENVPSIRGDASPKVDSDMPTIHKCG